LRKERIKHYFSYPKSLRTSFNVKTIEEELWLIEGVDCFIEELKIKEVSKNL